MEKLMLEHNELKIELEREYDELAERQRSFQREHHTVQTLSSKIKEYNSKKQEKLHDLQKKVANFEYCIEKCKSRKNELSLREKELSSELSGSKELLSQYCEYEDQKKKVEKLARKINMLEEKKASIGRISAFETDLERQMRKKEKLLAKLNRRHGSLLTYKHKISKYKLDLAQSKYTDIDKRCLNKLIELVTNIMANEDLDKYYNAVDQAIMQLRTVKLDDLNKIVRELWQQTYRGQDIDYISIISDSEGARTRSYAYRVVMQTGDAELEMRGRCSAGQKVLASIIIRLALAETFCLNCGILALDEPTTNLDRPNAESLAASLLSQHSMIRAEIFDRRSSF